MPRVLRPKLRRRRRHAFGISPPGHWRAAHPPISCFGATAPAWRQATAPAAPLRHSGARARAPHAHKEDGARRPHLGPSGRANAAAERGVAQYGPGEGRPAATGGALGVRARNGPAAATKRHQARACGLRGADNTCAPASRRHPACSCRRLAPWLLLLLLPALLAVLLMLLSSCSSSSAPEYLAADSAVGAPAAAGHQLSGQYERRRALSRALEHKVSEPAAGGGARAWRAAPPSDIWPRRPRPPPPHVEPPARRLTVAPTGARRPGSALQWRHANYYGRLLLALLSARARPAQRQVRQRGEPEQLSRRPTGHCWSAKGSRVLWRRVRANQRAPV